jgi:hypothetical protein
MLLSHVQHEFGFGVFGGVRRRTDHAAAPGRRYTSEDPRRPELTLGVKGSQVQSREPYHARVDR